RDAREREVAARSIPGDGLRGVHHRHGRRGDVDPAPCRASLEACRMSSTGGLGGLGARAMRVAAHVFGLTVVAYLLVPLVLAFLVSFYPGRSIGLPTF